MPSLSFAKFLPVSRLQAVMRDLVAFLGVIRIRTKIVIRSVLNRRRGLSLFQGKWICLRDLKLIPRDERAATLLDPESNDEEKV